VAGPSMRTRVARCLALGFVLLVVLLLATPGPARADDDGRSAKKSKYVEEEDFGATPDLISLDRLWRMPKSDPRRLLGSIELANGSATPIAQYLTEGIPGTSLESIRFSPESLGVQTSPGLARFTVTVPPNGSVTVSYEARLVKEPKTTAKKRLSEVRSEISDAVANAQPTPDDVANASWSKRYFGQIHLDAASATNATVDMSRIGIGNDAVLNLAPDGTNCTVPLRGCGFSANESYFGTVPKLSKLTPSGPALTAEDTAPRAAGDGGTFTCQGIPTDATANRRWIIEPTKAKLTVAWWQVTEVHYSVVEDVSGPGLRVGNGQCLPPTAHREYSGVLTG